MNTICKIFLKNYRLILISDKKYCFYFLQADDNSFKTIWSTNRLGQNIVSMSENFNSNYSRWTYISDKTRSNSESVVKYLLFSFQPWLHGLSLNLYKNNFRLNGGFKINGGSKPFLNHHFLPLGYKKNIVRKKHFFAKQ